jgi:hypothetical protein
VPSYEGKMEEKKTAETETKKEKEKVKLNLLLRYLF